MYSANLDHTNRCDISSMAKNALAYRFAQDSDAYVCGKPGLVKEQVSRHVYRSLLSKCIKHDVSLSSVFVFTLHQLFHIYGNGGSVSIAFLPSSDDAPFMFSGSSEELNHTCYQAISGIHEALMAVASRAGPIPHENRHIDCVSWIGDIPSTLESLHRPLSFSLEEKDGELALISTYDQDHFEKHVVKQFSAVICCILEQLSENLMLKISELECIPESVHNQLELWNHTEGNYLEGKRLNNLIEDATERVPNKTAIVYRNVRRTYREINTLANQLAYYIKAKIRVNTEDLIALFLDKSDLMIITILAIWKSGAAYVPIDPGYPDDRVRFILGDTGVKVVIANEKYVTRMKEQTTNVSVIPLEPLVQQLVSGELETQTKVTPGLHSKQLAYLTYTSGTTGTPKGISKIHTRVVNSITDLSERYGMVSSEKAEVVLLFAAYVFEPFVRQTLMALINGHVLVVIDDSDRLDSHKVTSLVQRHGVTYLNATASVVSELDFSHCPSLQRLILVGEDLTEQRYRTLRTCYKHRIFNEYGFTESAFVTALKLFEPWSQRSNRSLGHPLRNVKWYILNKDLKRLPIGAIGELHIGGLGVAKGYTNRPELTKAKFLPNPFQSPEEKLHGKNGTIYKTGDLARFLSNGEVEYIGRNDFQIKLRGLRIEPGEIETAMSLFPGVKSCVVLAREYTNGKHLIGYFLAPSAKIPEERLLAHLETKLPQYMIPTRLLQISRIPVTINGKTDFRALPHVELASAQQDIEEVRDELSIWIRQTWSELLAVPVTSISPKSNFFRLGGHSIVCIQLIGRARRELEIEITIEDVFTTKTLENLANLFYLRQSATITRNASENSEFKLPSENNETRFLANSLQQGFVYRHLKWTGKNDEPYTLQTVYDYSASLEVDLFKEAWTLTQKRFPCMRSRFSWSGDIVQLIDNNSPLAWNFEDYSQLEPTCQARTIEQLRKSERDKGFKLDTSGLFRVHLLKLGNSRFSCVFSCHHAIIDGWSLPIVFESVHEFYLQLLNGDPYKEEPDQSYYKALRYLEEHQNDHLHYWRGQIDKIYERCDLSVLIKSARRQVTRLDDYDNIIDQREKSIVIEHCWTDEQRETFSGNGITLHSILQFIWHFTLHKYGQGGQTVVGTVVSGRNIPIDGIDECAGLFINTLPLVVNHEDQMESSIIDLISEIQNQVNGMNSHSNVLLSSLKDGKLKHGLFDTLFVLENYPQKVDSLELSHQRILGYEVRNTVEKLDYPIAVVAKELQDGDAISFSICYAGELFDDTTIDDLLQMVEILFAQVLASPNQKSSDLEYLASAQMALLSTWNTEILDVPTDATLHGMFELQASRVSDKIAVIDENNALNYRQLNATANSVAAQIQNLNCFHPESLVAIVMDKSVWLIAGFLGTWKAGAAFVPIDPAYPDDRIKFILNDTGAKVVLANKRNSSRMKSLSENVIGILELDSDCGADQAHLTNDPLAAVRSTDLAYVMYTSGTTGRPKGVMIEHRGVINLQVSLAKLFGLQDTNDEVFFTFSNPVFDHFIEVFTDALLNGQTLLILHDAMRSDKERLYNYMAKHKVTYLSGTPTVISMYEYDRFDTIRRIDCIGEAFSEAAFGKIRETFNGLIINGYGPTEISITSHKKLYHLGETRKTQSIGNQVSNTATYVLDANLNLLPIGAVGELYIGGIGVARGYLNRNDLTLERFVKNPFQSREEQEQGLNGRLYRTGDLVRWIPEAAGEIEYLGRNDFQVKIRGVRIELGEIESVMARYPGVQQCAVLATDQMVTAKSNTTKILVAYYCSSTKLQEDDIRKFMLTQLPENLVPRRIMALERLPITVSGKLDTKSLPKVVILKEPAVAPRNEVELVLYAIWSDLLGLCSEDFGVHNDFFDLGGDSLLSTRLSFRILQELGISVPVASLFIHTTISAISNLIHSNESQLDTIPRLKNGSEPVPLSFAQKGIVFIGEYENGTDAYNIAYSFTLSPDVNREALKQALRSTISKHGALRTLLTPTREGEIFQKVLEPESAQSLFEVPEVFVTDMDDLDDCLTHDSRHIFQLDSQLPIRVRLYKVNAGVYISLVLHHSCFDAHSWRLFESDLKLFYSAHTGILPKKKPATASFDYLDFSSWQRNTFSGQRRSELKGFWLKQLEEFQPVTLVTDFPRSAYFEYKGNDVVSSLASDVLTGLKKLAASLGITLHSILLAAYCIFLSTYTNERDVTIGVPVAGRTRPEFDDIVGCFVNMVPFRTEVDARSTTINFLRCVRNQLIQTQINQDMPFHEIIKDQNLPKDSRRHPLVQVIFNFESVIPHSETRLQGDSALEMTEYHLQSSRYTTSKFDLATTAILREDGLDFVFNYPVNLFEERTIKGYADIYNHILQQLSAMSCKDSLRLCELSLCKMPATRQERMVEDSGDNVCQGTLGDTFREIVRASSSDDVAVICGTKRLSYIDLDRMSDLLAAHIRSAMVIQSDDVVALILDRNELLIISIIAIWKTGAAYMPIDPRYPNSRIAYMLSDSNAKIVITNDHYNALLKAVWNHGSYLLIESALETNIQNDKIIPLSPARNESLAYMIYTSGTTGQPKAVMVEHRNVISFWNSVRQHYFKTTVKRQHGVLLLSNYVFDFSVEQIALSVLSGNRLIIPPEDIDFGDEFYSYLNECGLTYLSGTPSLLQHFDLGRIKDLIFVVSAGEQIHQSQYWKLRSNFQGHIYNAFGATETTVYNMVSEFKDTEFVNSLGSPLPNTTAYVLNDALQDLPRGAIGELYLSGNCVTRGYKNKPEVTRKAYLHNPSAHGQKAHQILYRTGDLVRKTTLDSIEYLGRKDNQVKLRGFRIELGEIRAALSSIPGIFDSGVFMLPMKADESDERQLLTAYYVAEDESLTVSVVLHKLKQLLPTHAIPGKLVRLGELPLTNNGKVDLQAIADNPVAKNEDDTAPATAMELKIARIWASLIGLDSVGVNDDFFGIGGDSILSLQAVKEIRSHLNLAVSVKDIFEARTVRNLVNRIYSNTELAIADQEYATEQGILTGDVPLLPIQEWFFRKGLADTNHWNQFFTIKVPHLNLDQLRSALKDLTTHHDALRLRFQRAGSGRRQSYSTDNQAPILHIWDDELVGSSLIDNRLFENVQSSLDIEHGPVFAVCYIHGRGNFSRIVFICHHLVVDTVSWRILTRDLERLYNGGSLGEKGTSLRQWAKGIRDFKFSDAEKQYWNELVASAPSWVNSLPSPTLIDPATDSLQMTRSQTSILLDQCFKVYNARIVDLLLAGVISALQELTKKSIIHILIESHGREDINREFDLTSTAGWFTSMFPAAINVPCDTVKTIEEAKNYFKRVRYNGLAFGVLHGYQSAILPKVTFNYLGQFNNQDDSLKSCWQLVSTQGSSGLSTSRSDVNCNDALLDITAMIIDGELKFNISNHIGPHFRLVAKLEEKMESIIRIGKEHPERIFQTEQQQEEFIPYFTFPCLKPNKPNLFILPPGEGGAESYLNNIRQHISSYNLVIFNNYYLHSGTESSFETLAKMYLDYVRGLQPEGPYHLLGWSFGGILSFEMSRQLKSTNQKVSNLFLIDPYFDVNRTTTALELESGGQDLLDPIHFNYLPQGIPETERKEKLADKIILFKATEMHNQFRTGDQKKLFQCYLSSPFNQLDTLVVEEHISKVTLDGASHFSWTKDPSLVARMSRIIDENCSQSSSAKSTTTM